MDPQTPVNFDNETVDGLLAGWLRALEPLGVGGIIVIAPSIGGRGVETAVAAVHPPLLISAAQNLIQTCDLEPSKLATSASDSLVDWFDLRAQSAAPASKWRWLLLAHGMRSMMRLRFPLPFGHYEDCYLLSAKTWTHRSEAAELAWAVLGAWPLLKRALVNHRTPLNARELHCLRSSSRGLTAAQTATDMGCNERYVGYLMGHVMRKLRANSKSEAVFHAAILGLL